MADTRSDLVDALAEHIGATPLIPPKSSQYSHWPPSRRAAPATAPSRRSPHIWLASPPQKADNRIEALDDIRRRTAELAPAPERS